MCHPLSYNRRSQRRRAEKMPPAIGIGGGRIDFVFRPTAVARGLRGGSRLPSGAFWPAEPPDGRPRPVVHFSALGLVLLAGVALWAVLLSASLYWHTGKPLAPVIMLLTVGIILGLWLLGLSGVAEATASLS